MDATRLLLFEWMKYQLVVSCVSSLANSGITFRSSQVSMAITPLSDSGVPRLKKFGNCEDKNGLKFIIYDSMAYH